MKTLWMFISILLISLVTAMFAVINTSPVMVHFVVTDAELPLVVIILASTLLGGLIVGLIFMIKQFKLRRTMKRLERQLNEFKKEQTSTAPVYAASAAQPFDTVTVAPVSDHTVPH